MQEMWLLSLGQEDLLEKEMATHSSILACRIPWTEEPGRVQSWTWLSTHTVNTRKAVSFPHTFSPNPFFPISKSESEVAWSCPTLCDHMDYSLPGFFDHGIFQARVPEWPFPSPGDLPDPGIEPTSPALQADALPQSRLGSPLNQLCFNKISFLKNCLPCLKYLCIYFWMCWIFVAFQGLSLVAASRGYSLVVVCRLRVGAKAWALGMWASAAATHGLSSCG